MLIYENLGQHPRRPAAWDIISYDTDAPDRIFCYYGYRDSRCYMTLYLLARGENVQQDLWIYLAFLTE